MVSEIPPSQLWAERQQALKWGVTGGLENLDLAKEEDKENLFLRFLLGDEIWGKGNQMENYKLISYRALESRKPKVAGDSYQLD